MPSQIEVGDIVWLAVQRWLPLHGKGPFRVVKVGGFESRTLVVTDMDGSVPKGSIDWGELTPGLYLDLDNVRKDEFLSALEQAWKAEHAKI